MSTNKVIIFGLEDSAELAHYYLTKDTSYEIIGFTVNQEFLKNEHFKPRNSDKTYSVYPFENIENIFPPSEYQLFAPMTGTKMNLIRKKILCRFSPSKFLFMNVENKLNLFGFFSVYKIGNMTLFCVLVRYRYLSV